MLALSQPEDRKKTIASLQMLSQIPDCINMIGSCQVFQGSRIYFMGKYGVKTAD